MKDTRKLKIICFYVPFIFVNTAPYTRIVNYSITLASREETAGV